MNLPKNRWKSIKNTIGEIIAYYSTDRISQEYRIKVFRERLHWTFVIWDKEDAHKRWVAANNQKWKQAGRAKTKAIAAACSLPHKNIES